MTTDNAVRSPISRHFSRRLLIVAPGMTVPMEKLDDLVARHLEERLRQPARLEAILAAVLDRRQEQTDRRRDHMSELNKRAAESELRLKRLYAAIEAGVADINDPALKDRIAGLKAIRDQANAERDHALLEASGTKPVSASILKGESIAATICTPWRSASRSPRAKSGSSDRRPACLRR